MSRRGALNIAQIVLRELDAERAEVLVQALQFARTGNGHDPRLLSQQPGQRDLGGCRVLPLGGGLEQVDQRQIRFPCLRGESRNGVADVAAGERSVLVDLAGQKAFAKWAEGDEADPELFECRQYVLLPAVETTGNTRSERPSPAAPRVRDESSALLLRRGRSAVLCPPESGL